MTDTETDDLMAAANQRLAETDATVAALAEALARIDRDRRRVRPEDWDTLFRQMRTAVQQLAAHPFLAGDAHGEMLLIRIAASPDLAEFDRRVDALGEYVAGKLAFNAALRAVRDGKEPDATALLPRRFGATAPGAGRVVAQNGPSGSDFDLTGEGAMAQPRRGILRL
jgi:hypothetical protein